MIYIVDDDSAIRDSLRVLFECVSLEVRDFAIAERFLDTSRANNGECLILDIDMPGTGGFELLDRLRQRGDKVPVILITGHPTAANRNRASVGEAQAFLESRSDRRKSLTWSDGPSPGRRAWMPKIRPTNHGARREPIHGTELSTGHPSSRVVCRAALTLAPSG